MFVEEENLDLSNELVNSRRIIFIQMITDVTFAMSADIYDR